jgi:hypothetical protein
MQPRFVLSSNPKRHRAASRVGSAILFFLLGVITANSVYPNANGYHRSEYISGPDSRRAAARISAPDGISDRAEALSSGDRVAYMGGAIPEPIFAATQPAVAPAMEKAQVLPDYDHSPSGPAAEKRHQIANKVAHKKQYGHRRDGIESRPYREQPSYWAGRRNGNAFAWGNQFYPSGQFAMWR